jgi:3-isopropylmalate dehydrogenase
MIMSGKMLFDWLAIKRNEPKAREAGELMARAMERVIAKARHLTRDLGGRASTAEMGDAVAAAV